MKVLNILALGAAVALAACVQPKPKEKVDLSTKLKPGCYTVDLFDPYRIEYPDAAVPADARQFLGVWKNGAWNGNWCHNLYVTKVHADGRVDVLDTHGPSPYTGVDATAFKRTGSIKNGVMSFRIDGLPVSYRLVDGFLVGQRKLKTGELEITMSREDGIAQVPIPPVKPVRRS
ncbi:MAG: hypothetical protein AAFV19_19575 [Pseudomonadota bacterium]